MKKFSSVIYLLMMTSALMAGTYDRKVAPALVNRAEQTADTGRLLIWVSFTDKQARLEKFYSTPETILSKRSLMRRARAASSGAILDNTDLPVSAEYINELKEHGFEVRRVSKWLNAVSGYIHSSRLNELSALPYVKNLDVVYKLKKPTPVREGEPHEPEAPGELKKTHSLNYGKSYTQVSQINVPAVHDMGLHGEGVMIGVFDAGFDNLAHPAFSQMNIVAKYDFVNNDQNVGNQNDMGEGSHGTGTLSTIGGFVQGELIGPAYKATYVLAKTENTDSETPVEEDNWIAALEWADSIGVDLTSTSLGYIDYDSPFTSYTWQNMNGNTARITIAADLAVKKGITVVNSAGNEGDNSQHNTLGAPADGDSVIAVGAVDSKGNRVGFSSVGPTSDGRIKPDVMAMGSSVYMAGSFGSSYIYNAGTSFSGPLTAGVAALVIDAYPDITPMQVRDALRKTASRSSNPDNKYGWGIVNALEAVKYAQKLSGKPVDEKTLPENYALLQNYPNPFNPSTTVVFNLPEQSGVRLELFDILGRRIATLLDGLFAAGEHQYLLNSGSYGLSSGIYFLRLQAGGYTGVIKTVLAK